jgi:hypothetical protein
MHVYPKLNNIAVRAYTILKLSITLVINDVDSPEFEFRIEEIVFRFKSVMSMRIAEELSLHNGIGIR